MKKNSIKILLGFLIAQIAMGPVFAADYTQFGNALNNNQASGLSFRKGDGSDLKDTQTLPQTPEQQMMNKSTMMMDPSMATLTYQVHILGEVKKPGTYRITASDRLSEVLQKAGGISDQGSERSVEIRRQGEGTRKADLLKFQLFGSLNDNPYLLDNDVVFVPLKSATIQVVGAVKRPRDYEIRNEKTLADVLKLAGGPSVGVSKDSPIRIVRFVGEKKEVIEVAQNDAAMSSAMIQNGDTIYVPHVITDKNKFDYDVPKLPGDNIFYPSFEDRVFVLGGVNAPGAYSFNPYYTLPQYLSLAGGTSPLATGKISILSPDGKTRKIKQKDRSTIVINPGDTVLVAQRRIPPEGWVSLVMGIASFGLSTTATVLALRK